MIRPEDAELVVRVAASLLRRDTGRAWGSLTFGPDAETHRDYLHYACVVLDNPDVKVG